MQRQTDPVGKQVVRPTKKQQEILAYIEQFIAEHGYSPSFREIKTGCGYNSVATVALHVNNLITRGHLQKRNHSARSLEVISPYSEKPVPKLRTNEVKPSDEKWLIDKIEDLLHFAESDGSPSDEQLEDIQALIKALEVLGLVPAAQSLSTRFASLKAQKQ